MRLVYVSPAGPRVKFGGYCVCVLLLLIEAVSLKIMDGWLYKKGEKGFKDFKRR